MGLFDTIKSGISGVTSNVKSFIQDPSVSGREPNTFDYFVDEFGRLQKKVATNVNKFIIPETEEDRQKVGLYTIPGSNTVIDPLGGIAGASSVVRARTARVLKAAVQRGVSREGLQSIIKMGEKAFEPAKNTLLRELNNFTMKEMKTRTGILNDAVKKIIPEVNLREVVKVRRSGTGLIKVTRSELETMKNMGDLKPRVGERFFQNPIRVFEELGTEAKELFYRPIKLAEGLTIKSKNFWNDDLSKVIRGLNSKSSRKIMQYAMSLEDDGAKILRELGQEAPTLSAKETEAYNYMRTRYDDLLEELNAARAIYGKDPIKKRANYFTHIKNMNVLEQMGYPAASADIEMMLQQNIHRNAPAFAWGKRRTGALRDIELDAFNVFKKYQEKALENINMTPAIAKVRELSRTTIPDGVKRFKLQDAAPNTSTYINNWLDYVAGQKVPQQMPQALQRMLSTLNRNMAFAVLSGNIRSAVIQPSAIINSITEIGVKNTSSGIKGLLGGQGKFALKNSSVLEGRQFETAIQDIANNTFGKFGRAKSKVGELGLKPLQVLDNLTAQATWLGGYRQAVDELGMVGQKAYNYADDVVTRTQASAARSDVAKVQRTVLGKVTTQFQTFVINDFNRIFRDVLGVGVDRAKLTAAENQKLNREVVRKAATYLIGVNLYNYVAEDVLGLPTPFPRPIQDYKEEGGGLKGIKEGAIEISSQVPIIGGPLRYGSGMVGAGLDLGQTIFDKVNGRYTSESWWELSGKVLGVPGTNQIKKSIRAVKGLEDGYQVTTSDGKKVKIRFTDPIDKVRAFLFGLYATKGAQETRETGKKPKSSGTPQLRSGEVNFRTNQPVNLRGGEGVNLRGSGTTNLRGGKLNQADEPGLLDRAKTAFAPPEGIRNIEEVTGRNEEDLFAMGSGAVGAVKNVAVKGSSLTARQIANRIDDVDKTRMVKFIDDVRLKTETVSAKVIENLRRRLEIKDVSASKLADIFENILSKPI